MEKGPTYGLDAELAAKEAAKYNPADEAMVCDWINKVCGESKSGDFLDWLKDGKVLIKLMNSLAGSSLKANESAMPFKQMENISNFLKACRDQLLMRENDLFTTADLYDGKSRVNVINGLIATSRAASKNGYKGPSIAPSEASSGGTKHWDVKAGGSGEVSKLSMGSAGIMERSEVSKAGNITFGNEVAGTGDKGGVSRMNLGSAGVMERPEVSKANDINFGAKAGGKN